VRKAKIGNKKFMRSDKGKQGAVRTKKIKKFDVWK
jgi:hypothetical protein